MVNEGGIQLIWSPEAQEDLQRIQLFIARLFSTPTANKSIRKIIDSAGHLQRFPKLGRVFISKNAQNEEVRCLIKANSRIFYSLEEGKVLVLRIVDGRQEPPLF